MVTTPAWEGPLEPGRNPVIPKVTSQPTQPRTETLPASGRAPSGSVPTSCAAPGQMLPLLEAEEAALHLATPAAAAPPRRDTCRGHLVRPRGAGHRLKTSGCFLWRGLGNWLRDGRGPAQGHTGVSTPAVGDPPTAPASPPMARSIPVSGRAAAAPTWPKARAGIRLPLFPPITSPGAAPSECRGSAPLRPCAARPRPVALAPPPQEFHPLAAPLRRTLGPRTPGR